MAIHVVTLFVCLFVCLFVSIQIKDLSKHTKLARRTIASLLRATGTPLRKKPLLLRGPPLLGFNVLLEGIVSVEDLEGLGVRLADCGLEGIVSVEDLEGIWNFHSGVLLEVPYVRDANLEVILVGPLDLERSSGRQVPSVKAEGVPLELGHGILGENLLLNRVARRILLQRTTRGTPCCIHVLDVACQLVDEPLEGRHVRLFGISHFESEDRGPRIVENEEHMVPKQDVHHKLARARGPLRTCVLRLDKLEELLQQRHFARFSKPPSRWKLEVIGQPIQVCCGSEGQEQDPSIIEVLLAGDLVEVHLAASCPRNKRQGPPPEAPLPLDQKHCGRDEERATQSEIR